MIFKYFPLAETLAYLGIALFALNIILLATYYIRMLVNKDKKIISIKWIIINSVFTVIELVSLIMFIICLVSPALITSQGKIDPNTIIGFIVISLIMLIIPLVHFIVIIACSNSFGCFIKDNNVVISYTSYSAEDFTVTGTKYKFGKKKKWMSIKSRSKLGQFIANNFLK